MGWRGRNLDDVVVVTVAWYGPLTTSSIVDTIDPREWKRAGQWEIDNPEDTSIRRRRSSVPQLQYQTMLVRLHKLAERGLVTADTKDARYHWRLLTREEAERLRDNLLAEWACPKKLRRRIEAAAADMQATVEFDLEVRTIHDYRYTWQPPVSAMLHVRFPRGDVSAIVEQPKGNLWRAAAEEVGLL
jgi:hypothetical protein